MKNKKKMGIIITIIFFILILVVLCIFLLKKDTYYDITFSYNNKTDTVEVLENDVVNKPVNPEKDGYKFVGWYYQNELFDFTTPITKDMVLIAKWEIDGAIKFVVDFDSDGGSKVESLEVLEGETISKLPTPTKDGYKFVGWYYNGSKFSLDTVITKDILLTAKWEKEEEKDKDKEKENSSTNSSNSSNNTNSDKTVNYTITFNSNGGTSVKKQTVSKNSKAVQPTNPTKDGYKFVGWYNGNTKFNFDTKITANITLTAKWEKVETTPSITTYTITFDSNGGSNVSSQKVESGKTVSKPTNPTRDGYTFVSWTLNGSTYDFQTAITGNITLVANWKKNVTYSLEWQAIPSSSVGQYYLYIKSSEGNYVSGKVKITSISGKSETMSVPSTGLMLVKNAVSSAEFISVD